MPQQRAAHHHNRTPPPRARQGQKISGGVGDGGDFSPQFKFWSSILSQNICRGGEVIEQFPGRGEQRVSQAHLGDEAVKGNPRLPSSLPMWKWKHLAPRRNICYRLDSFPRVSTFQLERGRDHPSFPQSLSDVGWKCALKPLNASVQAPGSRPAPLIGRTDGMTEQRDFTSCDSTPSPNAKSDKWVQIQQSVIWRSRSWLYKVRWKSFFWVKSRFTRSHNGLCSP